MNARSVAPKLGLIKALTDARARIGATAWEFPTDKPWSFFSEKDTHLNRNPIEVLCVRCNRRLYKAHAPVDLAEDMTFTTALLECHDLLITTEYFTSEVSAYVGQCSRCHSMYWTLFMRGKQPRANAALHAARQHRWNAAELKILRGVLIRSYSISHFFPTLTHLARAQLLYDSTTRKLGECRFVFDMAIKTLNKCGPEEVQHVFKEWERDGLAEEFE